MKWGHRDWIWLMICMSSIICSYINKSEFLNLIAFISTFISIALAAVAIFISIREATKVDNVKDNLNMLLGEMKEKISHVDSKVSSIDVRILKEIDRGINHVRSQITSQENGSNAIESNIQEQLTNLEKRLKSVILRPQKNDYYYNSEEILRDLVYAYGDEEHRDQIPYQYHSITGNVIPAAQFKAALRRYVQELND